ncbi:uncharacterized protein IL334_000057 [Kwoniella shivajii]|uniref:Secreted protein n=1 Tax=Kwoniella shivajii TaxID=564305 RepID=A0ABZ1CPJ5_9TREE|nr:hypothetical protein IL334_000057 [Kwoniella shivajii]
MIIGLKTLLFLGTLTSFVMGDDSRTVVAPKDMTIDEFYTKFLGECQNPSKPFAKNDEEYYTSQFKFIGKFQHDPKRGSAYCTWTSGVLQDYTEEVIRNIGGSIEDDDVSDDDDDE